MGRLLLSLLLLVVQSTRATASGSFEVQYIFPPEIPSTVPDTAATATDGIQVAFGSVTHDGYLLLSIEHAPERLHLESIWGEWIFLQLKHEGLIISSTMQVSAQLLSGGEGSALEDDGVQVDLPQRVLLARNTFTVVAINDLLEITFAEAESPVSVSFVPPRGSRLDPVGRQDRHLSKIFLGNSPRFHRYKTDTHVSLWLPPLEANKYGPNKPFITLDIYSNMASTLHGSYFQRLMFRGDQLQAMHEIEVVEANDIVVFVPISIPRHAFEALGPTLRSALNPASSQFRLFRFPRNLDYRQIIAILII